VFRPLRRVLTVQTVPHDRREPVLSLALPKESFRSRRPELCRPHRYREIERCHGLKTTLTADMDLGPRY